jgi:hypothetical protein
LWYTKNTATRQQVLNQGGFAMKSIVVLFCILIALSIGGYFFVSEAMAAPVQGETQNGVTLKLVGSSANQTNSAGGLAGGLSGGYAGGANIRVAQY